MRRVLCTIIQWHMVSVAAHIWLQNSWYPRWTAMTWRLKQCSVSCEWRDINAMRVARHSTAHSQVGCAPKMPVLPAFSSCSTPNLPTYTIPTNIAWLKLSGKSPMDMKTPPLKIKMMLESNPPKPTMLVGRLGVEDSRRQAAGRRRLRGRP